MVVAAACLTALARPRGVVAFVLGVGVVGFAEIVVLSHALSFVDAYERDWLLVALAAVAAASAVAAAIMRPPWPSLRRLAVLREVLGDRVVAVLAIVVALETVYVLALALFVPPNDIDSLTYHLMRGALWIQQEAVWPVGDIRDTRIDEFQPNAEILQALTMLLSESARFARLVASIALGIATLAVYGLAGRIGLDRRSAAFGALLFPTLPVVALQSSTPLTDIVVAALVVTAGFFVLGRSRGELVLACLAVALLVGTKVTGLLSPPLLLAIVSLRWREGHLGVALVGGTAAVIVGGAWFIVHRPRPTGRSARMGRTRRHSGDGLAPMMTAVDPLCRPDGRAPRRGGEGCGLLVVAVAVSSSLPGSRPPEDESQSSDGALIALPVTLVVVEHVLRRTYFRRVGSALGNDDAAGLGVVARSDARAPIFSPWYGPVGLALTVGATVLAARAVARRGGSRGSRVVCVSLPSPS